MYTQLPADAFLISTVAEPFLQKLVLETDASMQRYAAPRTKTFCTYDEYSLYVNQARRTGIRTAFSYRPQKEGLSHEDQAPQRCRL